MSRSVALTVFMVVGASYLVATVKVKWYDTIIQGKNYSPLDVYAILKHHEGSDQQAKKYFELWNHSVFKVCSGQPYTDRYDGKLGTEQTPCVAMEHYIKHCEKRRREYCMEKLQKIEDSQSMGSYPTGMYLTILANFGNANAKKILEMLKPDRMCESLDEMRELASYPLHEGKKTKITIEVAKFQKTELEQFKVKCGKYNAALQVFREKVEVLEKDLTKSQSSNLEGLEKKAFSSYLLGVDPKNIRSIKEKANIYYGFFRLLFISEIKSSCQFLDYTIGTYDESMSNTPLSAKEYIDALENIPTCLEITPEELEWIQKFFLCRAIFKQI